MKNRRIWLLLVVVSALLVAPLVLYALNFNGGVSQLHVRWSEFGAYVGGIYAPVAAFITLTIVARQLLSQVEFNKHHMDQSFLANARADLHYYLDQLRHTLSKHERLGNVPLSETLVEVFGSYSHEALRAGAHEEMVQRIGRTDDRIVALWEAVYTIFAGLKAVPENDYELVYSSSKQKCIATFGFALCDALDNFHYVSSGYPQVFAYEFHAGPRQER